MKLSKKHMLLYAVTDRRWSEDTTLYEQVEQALQGGVSTLQLREKNLSDEEFLKEAMEIKELCKKYNVPLIINDNVEVAIKCGADGVHVGQEDMEASKVREKVGPEIIIGVSAHNVEEARRAVSNGADYLGVGAVFNTSTKDDVDVLKKETLKEICLAVKIPVVAIGGINQDNILELKGTGVDGVAVVSAIFSSENIVETCKKLRKLSEEMVRP